jgi:hypothetical protein
VTPFAVISIEIVQSASEEQEGFPDASMILSYMEPGKTSIDVPLSTNVDPEKEPLSPYT